MCWTGQIQAGVGAAIADQQSPTLTFLCTRQHLRELGGGDVRVKRPTRLPEISSQALDMTWVGTLA